jgi:hypothetical protein
MGLVVLVGWLGGLAALWLRLGVNGSRVSPHDLPILLVLTAIASFVQFIVTSFLIRFLNRKLGRVRPMTGAVAGSSILIIPVVIMSLLVGGSFELRTLFTLAGSFLMTMFLTTGIIFGFGLAVLTPSDAR